MPEREHARAPAPAAPELTQPMMVVVTGYKRSGTSLMMALVGALGVPLNYTPAFEAALRRGHGGSNPFYYEHAPFTASPSPPRSFEGAVKVFAPVLQHNLPADRGHVFVLWMRRDPAAMERSLRRYKAPETPYAGPAGHSSSTLEDDLANIASLEAWHRDAELRNPHLLTVDFDELLEAPREVMRRVAAFLSRPCTPSMAEAFERLIVR